MRDPARPPELPSGAQSAAPDAVGNLAGHAAFQSGARASVRFGRISGQLWPGAVAGDVGVQAEGARGSTESRRTGEISVGTPVPISA